MLTQITFYPILGLPLIAWGGILTLSLFIFAATIGYLNSKGKIKPLLITYKSHVTIAVIALIAGIIHGLLGILAFI
jgi:hypothetical protein